MSRLGVWCAGMLLTALAGAAQYVSVPAATFRTALPPDGKSAPAKTAAFLMRTLPVTHAEFQAFVRRQTKWQRGQVPALFADAGYLRPWARNDRFGSSLLARQPVTHVSWFAADAYCRSEGGRLPTWYEWEWVAAAGEHRADAREDLAWRERILSWYSRPSSSTLAPVGMTPRNYYGVHDMHGLVWEWVDDFTSIMVSTDSREQGDPDLRKFCGAGAIAVGDRENYAVQMRLALLSSLQAAYTTGNLGFRCVREAGAR
jgi:formylglycine-generating enzyme